MEILRLILTYLLALLMIVAGITHFLKPRMYLKIVPEILPLRTFIVYSSGMIELLLGVGLLIPSLKYEAAFGVFILMIIFLPLHIWDVFRDKPAFGSKKAALIRLPIQFVLILWAFFVMGSNF